LGPVTLRDGTNILASEIIILALNTHPFNGPLSGTTQVSRYQNGKNNLDFTEARDTEWQWRQLGRMHVCTSLQTDNHASTPPLSFFTGRMPFLPPNQQRQSTEGKFILALKSKVTDFVYCNCRTGPGVPRPLRDVIGGFSLIT